MLNKGSIAAGAAGAATGGVGAGLATGGLAAIPGALIGGIGGVSGALETGLSYTEFLKEELDKEGLSFDEDNVKKILLNEEAMNSIKNKALARGLTIAAIDAFSGGLATSVTRKTATKLGSKLAGATAGGTVEALGGATGEAAARLVTGQEMDIAEIGFEGVAGTATAPLTVGAGLMKPPSYSMNGGKASRKDIQTLLSTGTPEQIAAVKISVKNDSDLYKEAQTKKSDIILLAEIEAANPGIIEEDKSKLLVLEKARQTLANSNIKSAKNNLEIIDKQIDDISKKYLPIEQEVLTKEEKDAVQESSTETPPVSDQPGVGEEVGKRDTAGEITGEVTPQEETVAPTDQEITEEADVTEVAKKEKPTGFITKPSIEKPFIVPTKNKKPSSTQINFTEDGKIDSVVNKKTGKPVSTKTRKVAEKLYLESLIDVNDGKFTEYQEGVTEERANQFVAENSQNVREIAEAIESEKNSIVNQRLEFDEADVLYDIDGYFTIEDIAEVWDERLINENSKSGRNIRRYWTRPALDKFGSPTLGISKIDTTAQELGISVEALKEIIIDYPTRNINRPEEFSRAVAKVGKTDALIDLENKFEKLTGLKATDTNINTVLDIDPNRPPLTEEKKLSLIEREQAIVESEGERVIKGKKVSAEQVVGGKPKEVTVEEIKL